MQLVITTHALERWHERIGERVISITDAFANSRKLSTKQARCVGIRVEPHKRYYQHNLCYFVVSTHNNTLITVLPRHR